MSIAGYNTQVLHVRFPDEGGADIIPAIKAPSTGITVLNAYVIADTTFDADGSNYYAVNLIDGGQTGTGTTSMGGAGGASVDFTADTEAAMTLTQTGLDGGDWLHVQYTETGTVAPGNISVCVHYVIGGS